MRPTRLALTATIAALTASLPAFAAAPSVAAHQPTKTLHVSDVAASTGSTTCNDLKIDATYTIRGKWSYLNSVHAYETGGYDKLSSTTVHYRADGGRTTFTSESWFRDQDDDFTWRPNMGGVDIARKPYIKIQRKSLGGLGHCNAYIHLY
ncbi:hypothetical protein [Streptomyces decoyicus]|uniref:hypothetical protein n=1 Tax=Streptomyces decoyicus TaxID=249567 RepID=UPI0004AAE02B|nr:hypothetical protein [Streptomyces decoyicus]KOG41238.1 hypothetical protein ADK74_22110 [Streptomyces decoyicus]QZY20142.1 hypothetical protein K7C20_37120 [Streptomyces decoyicus]